MRVPNTSAPASLPACASDHLVLHIQQDGAMTGLRLGYVAARDPKLRERMKKVLFYTASNIASVVQFGGIGALEGSQACIQAFRTELQARRDLFYAGIREHAAGALGGEAPKGAFYAFLKIGPAWQPSGDVKPKSISWAMAEYLISRGRIGCVPGVDFGTNGEGYIRLCFARERRELTGALESMRELFSTASSFQLPASSFRKVCGKSWKREAGSWELVALT
jgi:aspartate/methionine/tyrosine aminotransferase